MRFLLPDPLGNDKHSQMFHSSGFAIAAGVIAVGAAAGSAAISMSAADRAKKAQGAAAGAFKKQQREAVSQFEQGQKKVGKMIKGVKAPQYNLESMIADAGRITQSNIQQGQSVSDYYRQQLEQFLPGAADQRAAQLQLTNQAMGILGERFKGQYGQDVTQKTLQDVAQFAGAGFNPATAGRAGGFQAAQGLAARQLGQTTLDVQNQAYQLMPSVSNAALSWQQLSRAFTADVNIANPLDVGRLQLGYGTAGAEIGLQKARMTGDMYNNIFNAQSGLATQIYGANKENAAASYAAQQAVGQGVSDIGQATSGALSGMSYASAAQQGLGGGMGGYANNPYSSYPLYNTPSSSSGVYYGGRPATGSMSDRPFAMPT